MNQIGIDTSKNSLEKQNIHLEEDGLAIALGGLHHGITPLQVAAAYGTYANHGTYRSPYFIREIYDRNGELIASSTVEEMEVVSSQTAWYMTRMLEAVVTQGTGMAGNYDGPLAGKTGTTSFQEIAGGARD
ncbi:penicillin-binding transpeptidase domain-containing protein, partial [Pseudomonas sp. 2822-15]|uniref:penicillin-binding transpeptidase domain-containing protein n=1 Tax=Pseudomonas sp. 2822-15 TaxID=1712677 RepID=UPI0021139AF5